MRLAICFCIALITHSVSAQELDIIPRPAEVKTEKSFFTISDQTEIAYDGNSEKSRSNAKYLVDYLKSYHKINCRLTGDIHGDNAILLMDGGKQDMQGFYDLKVDKLAISIGGDDDGIFYGIQTLIQLFPAGDDKQNITGKLQVPFARIKDFPRFSYRGMHLDVGRHFFPVSFVKKYIDYLALHKFNTFHWHLTEDQGWRIEIKKYPKLTIVGGWRNGTLIGRYPGAGNDNIRYGGFYTQEEIKDVVQYAKERYIDVIPEIEMPGHGSAAIAAYPWQSCFPQKPTSIPATMISKKSMEEQSKGKIKLVQETWGVFDDVFCAGKDSTFMFLQNVIDEVITLFPSKYFHIGGDECPKTHWKICPHCQKRMKDNGLKDEHELQSNFVQRIEKYLNSKGKTLIGWDEILEGGLAPKAVVMSWRGERGGIAAARENHEVIMTPGGWVYFDHTQSANEDSVTFGGFTPIEKVYSYEPVPDSLTAEQGKYVLGAQANVWTEYMKNTRKVEYMIFPRMSALSEVLWSQKKNRDWNDFEKRLTTQFKRYDLWNVNYSKAYYDLRASVLPSDDHDGVFWQLETKLKDGYIGYVPTQISSTIVKYSKPILVNQSGTKEAMYFLGNKPVSRVSQKFIFTKATGKKISLTIEPSRIYPGDGAFTLVNGVQNEKGMAKSKEFLGFNGTDMEAVIDLGEVKQISNVKAHVLEQTSSWIYRPKFMRVLISRDDEVYTEMGISDRIEMNGRNGIMTVQQVSVAARYIKVKLGNYGPIPDGNPGAGNKAWLFTDEIEVN